ncbi:MAG: hypothetical protein FLDDKLPJ_01812 [Phycisphaerae bacterium]|nr:hypothetical protein [Phycisphaerae bacterium]
MNINDPRLTAYVLEELTAEERRAVEAMLERSPDLAREAAALRRTARTLESALAAADAPSPMTALPVTAADAPSLMTALSVAAAGAGLIAAPSADELRRTRRSTSAGVRVQRAFRLAACFAVIGGAAWLIGRAMWQDTRPAAMHLVDASGSKTLNDLTVILNSGVPEIRLEHRGPGLIRVDNPVADAAHPQLFGGGFSSTDLNFSEDFLTRAYQTAGKPASSAGAHWMLQRGGDVIIRQFNAPTSGTAGAVEASGASELAGIEGVSYQYQVPFRKRDISGDGRPQVMLGQPSVEGVHLGFDYTPSDGGDGANADGERWFFGAHQTQDRLGLPAVAYMMDFDARVDEWRGFNSPDATGRYASRSRDDSLCFRELYAGAAYADELAFDLSTQETYAPIVENPFVFTADEAASTFSIDVDTASYSNIRRHLLAGQLPPKNAVRIEEMINAFRYDYPLPEADRPFSVNAEVGECPWAEGHRLVRIGLQGYEVAREQRPPANLVFLVDVSGSMQDENKLPLVRESLKVLLEQLWADDHVGIVTYAGESRVALPSTPGTRYREIVEVIDGLGAEGSTNGEAGIRDAYAMASENFRDGGVNRVVLCTDGDFNVGVSDDNELVKLIREQAKSGVFLTVLGFGTGNLKDGKLEALADQGNGHYAYIDDLIEAKRVLGDECGATLQTIAKDVKIQVEFNPAHVQAYRLVGYENRVMDNRDFADDTKDAGEIGAGHSVTALYEIVPAGLAWRSVGDDEFSNPEERVPPAAPSGAREGAGEAANVETSNVETSNVETSERQDAETLDEGDAGLASGEAGRAIPGDAMLMLRLRYKAPEADVSNLIEAPVYDDGSMIEQRSADFRFTAAVASFGLLLRQSPYLADWSFEAAEELARGGAGDDPSGYRTEFVDLVRKAIELRASRGAEGER